MRLTLSEDWLATLIGLAIVAGIVMGLLGSGPQNVVLNAATGEVDEVEVVAADGWQVTAAVGESAVTLEQAATRFFAGEIYHITCEDGVLTMQKSIGASSNSEKASVTLANHCEEEVTITYKTDPAVRWPLFGLLDKQ